MAVSSWSLHISYSINCNITVSYAEYGKVMNQMYYDLVGGVTDPEEHVEILRPIMEFAETLDNGDTAGE